MSGANMSAPSSPTIGVKPAAELSLSRDLATRLAHQANRTEDSNRHSWQGQNSPPMPPSEINTGMVPIRKRSDSACLSGELSPTSMMRSFRDRSNSNLALTRSRTADAEMPVPKRTDLDRRNTRSCDDVAIGLSGSPLGFLNHDGHLRVPNSQALGSTPPTPLMIADEPASPQMRAKRGSVRVEELEEHSDYLTGSEKCPVFYRTVKCKLKGRARCSILMLHGLGDHSGRLLKVSSRMYE